MTRWLCAAAACLAGCTAGPNYRRPVVPEPPAFPGQQPATPDSLADLGWWEIFHDNLLAALIKEALQNNQDLMAATARVEEARGLAGVARSEYYPQVGYAAGAERTQGVYKASPQLDLPSSESAKDLLLAGVATVWEADL